LLAAALLLRARTDGRRMAAAWRAEPVLAALAFYAAAGLIAAALSDAAAASLRDAVKDFHRIWSLGLFVAALAVEPEAPLLPALGLSFSVMAAVGIGQTVFGGTPDGMIVRAHGFVHPVVFGEQMALASLGGACFLLKPGALDARARRLCGAFAALSFAALALSQTRMALFAAAFGFAVVVALEPRARRWALPALGVVAALAAAWEVLPVGGRKLSALLRPTAGSSQTTRWALWDAAWRMFRDHPLTGVGPSGYRRFFTSYHAGALEGQTDWGSAHNLYLHQLAERGLLGGAALLVLLAALAVRAVRAARETPDARALWSAAAVAAFLLMCVTETSFQNEQFAALFLLIWAWGTTPLRGRGEIL
jgi:O-antigen ligase